MRTLYLCRSTLDHIQHRATDSQVHARYAGSLYRTRALGAQKCFLHSFSLPREQHRSPPRSHRRPRRRRHHRHERVASFRLPPTLHPRRRRHSPGGRSAGPRRARGPEARPGPAAKRRPRGRRTDERPPLSFLLTSETFFGGEERPSPSLLLCARREKKRGASERQQRGECARRKGRLPCRKT